MELTLKINARLRPMDRGERYEDSLDHILKKRGIGECCGGGTMQMASGEIEYCEVVIQIEDTYEAIDELKEILEQEVKVPKGSLLYNEEIFIKVGSLEGMAIYLNGTQLPQRVYDENDVNKVMEELSQRLESYGELYSYWEGSQETALYYYGDCFYNMKKQILIYVRHHPLCQKCRIEQIA